MKVSLSILERLFQEDKLDELLSHWRISSFEVSILTDGLINKSFRIDVTDSDSFILQRINQSVFPNPADLMTNHEIISQRLEQSDFQLQSPQWIRTTQDDLLQQFEDGYWRLGDFYKNTESYSIAKDADMAWNVGKAFGSFDKGLLGLSPSKLKDTIVEFHNLGRYLEKLRSTMIMASDSRLSTAKVLLDSIDDYLFLSTLPFPKDRVIHNDAKVSNLLFRDQQVHAVIDWDTTMGGHISWEFADLFRTTVVNVPEDHPEISDLMIQGDMLQGLSAGFKSVLFDLLSVTEKDSLYPGTLYLIFEQAIRFLEDYLAGDIYYHCLFDDHNYIRARNQFRLLALMMQDESAIKDTLHKS